MMETKLKEIKLLSSLLDRQRDALAVAGLKKKATYNAARHIQHLERDRRALQGQLPSLLVIKGGKDGPD